MKNLVVLGRILFSLIFLGTIMSHFTGGAASYAEAKGVPFAFFLVPLSGLIAITGGLSIAFGYKAKTGAWLIVIFLIPVTLMMHAFWKETDTMQVQMQMTNFMKNISMLGAALLIAYFGAGPCSLDNRSKSSKAETLNPKL